MLHESIQFDVIDRLGQYIGDHLIGWNVFQFDRAFVYLFPNEKIPDVDVASACVIFVALRQLIAPLLSQYSKIDFGAWRNNSHSNRLSHMASCIALTIAMNSDSVDERATDNCLRAAHEIAPP